MPADAATSSMRSGCTPKMLRSTTTPTCTRYAVDTSSTQRSSGPRSGVTGADPRASRVGGPQDHLHDVEPGEVDREVDVQHLGAGRRVGGDAPHGADRDRLARWGDEVLDTAGDDARPGFDRVRELDPPVHDEGPVVTAATADAHVGRVDE